MNRNILLTSLICVLAFVAGSVNLLAAEESPDAYRLVKVRLLPKPGAEGDLAGARIVGSPEGPTHGFVCLKTIADAPAAGAWVELTFDHPEVYRYVKFEAAPGRKAAVAEIEFYAETGKMHGEAFGTRVPNDHRDHAFEMAFDGDAATYFEAMIESSYVGLDLGRESQAPPVNFDPPGGVYPGAFELKLGTWPPTDEVRYTLDGTQPTTDSPRYTAPIPLRESTVVAAMAFQAGRCESDMRVATYRIGAEAVAQPEVRSYHIGNSLTDTINGVLPVLADSAGKNLYYMRKTIPGCGIRGNWEANGHGFGSPEGWATNYETVMEKKLDHLFLQPFPNPPGLDDDQQYGGNFIALAREHNQDVQPWLYAQWPGLGDWDRDAHCAGAGWMSPPWFPPAKPTNWEEGMANKMLYYGELFDRWNSVAGNKSLRLCPGGPALVRAKHMLEANQIPGMENRRFEEVFFEDEIHLSRAGRYLIGLVAYACMFEESPEGKVTAVISGLTPEQAKIFQRIAWETVLAEPRSGVKAGK